MAGRNFSEAVQFGVVKSNLEKNKGIIQCELCGKQIFSIGECHFDHIVPYAKGGTSTLDNCQILCVECNLKKCFLGAIRKFMEMKTITASLIRELIDHIEVHETEGEGKYKT